MHTSVFVVTEKRRRFPVMWEELVAKGCRAVVVVSGFVIISLVVTVIYRQGEYM